MDPISSGTTTERLIRTTLLVVVINGFGAAFLRDGFFGYARQNAVKLTDSLGIFPDAPPVIDIELTSVEAKRLVAEIAIGAPNSQVIAMLGEPSLEFGDDTYYLGPGGYIKVRCGGDKIVSAEWVDGPANTETDLAWQRGIGYVLGVIGLLAIVQLVRVVRTRADLTEKGLEIRGKPPVLFEAMTGIRYDRAKSGAVHLEYRDGGGTSCVPLDDYILKQRDAIVGAICERKEFPNPLCAEQGS